MRALPLVGLLLLAGCATPSAMAPTGPEVTTTADPSVLPEGTTDLALKAQTYYSPVGFVPPLAVTVPAGWRSSRRGDDAFDLTEPGVRIVFDTPPGDVVATALAGFRGMPLQATIAGEPATGYQLSLVGPVLTSPSKTLSVDRTAMQTVRVLGTDIDMVPLLVLVVLDRSRRVPPDVEAVLTSVTRG